MEDTRPLLEHGLQHHQEGRLRQAEELYRQVLQVDPVNPDGLNLLAVISAATDRTGEAIGLMEKAVTADPANRNSQTISDNFIRAMGALKRR
jgi:Flp pilus assembly protein TadD